MNSTLSLLLVFLNQFFMPRHNAQLRLLKAQITILRTRIPTERIILSPAEKAELLRIGEECGHDVDGLMKVAKPATYKRWLSQMRGGRPFQAVGRPRLTQELRDVVTRIGSENLLWGYKRIAGELKKLGLYADANSVKRILNDAGIHPSPERRKKKPALPWTTFIWAHMETMVACDFFSKTVFTLRGPRTAYVLMFIHLDSRRVFCSAPTYAPDSEWVTQQARNTLMWCAEQGITPEFLIRDADTRLDHAGFILLSFVTALKKLSEVNVMAQRIHFGTPLRKGQRRLERHKAALAQLQSRSDQFGPNVRVN